LALEFANSIALAPIAVPAYRELALNKGQSGSDPKAQKSQNLSQVKS
jgi:hypothetical protein